jgi:hypothetical protein
VVKKTDFGKPAFSVAMSIETGCIVMTRTLGEQVKVMGSLTREQSIEFAKSITDWVPEAAKERPKLSIVN